MSLRASKAFIPSLVGSLTFGLGVAAMPSRAGSTTGVYGYYGPQAGYSYKNQNSIYTNGTYGPVYAYVGVNTQKGGNAPSGYIGLVARMYQSSWFLVSDSGSPQYNSGQASGFSLAASKSGPDLATNFYSKGLTYAFNGSGYNTYSSFQSPDIYGTTP